MEFLSLAKQRCSVRSYKNIAEGKGVLCLFSCAFLVCEKKEILGEFFVIVGMVKS